MKLVRALVAVAVCGGLSGSVLLLGCGEDEDEIDEYRTGAPPNGVGAGGAGGGSGNGGGMGGGANDGIGGSGDGRIDPTTGGTGGSGGESGSAGGGGGSGPPEGSGA